MIEYKFGIPEFPAQDIMGSPHELISSSSHDWVIVPEKGTQTLYIRRQKGKKAVSCPYVQLKYIK